MMRLTTTCILLITYLALPQGARAQDPGAASATEEAEEAEPIWSSQVGLSYLATSGNSDTQSFGFDFAAARRPTPWGAEFVAQFNRAEVEDETTAERYYVTARGSRALATRWDVFAGLSAEKDQFAGFDLRSLVEGGATYKALLGPRHLLDIDLGLNWTDEDRVPPEEDASWFGGLAGLAYTFAITENASLSQGLRYFADFSDTDNWRADSVTALTASIIERLAMRFSYEIRYRNVPIDDNEDTDTTAKVSLVWSM